MEESLGQQWYANFWRNFLVRSKTWFSRNPVGYSDKQWSNYMFPILVQTATDLGYDAKKESPAIHKGRFDMLLSKGSSRIYVEHENDWVEDTLKDTEVGKLASVKADLAVLVTYVKKSDSPGNYHAEILKDKLEELGFVGEFLLVLGLDYINSPSDWMCHRIFSGLRREVLVLPTSYAHVSLRH